MHTTWDYLPETFTPVAQTQLSAGQDEVDRQYHAIITDLTGTPTQLMTMDGRIAWQARTTLWGIAIDNGDCPLRFPGQYHDLETGDHYNYHRYYDPASARFHSGDPLGLTPSPNPYAYVSNPTNEIDPLGLTLYNLQSGNSTMA